MTEETEKLVSTLSQRISELERRIQAHRQIKLLQFGGAALGLFFAGTLIVQSQAQKPSIPDTIKAREFVLVNDNGNEVARLGSVPGGTGLWLRDDQEKIRLYLGSTKVDETEIVFQDPAGKKLIALEAGDIGSSLSMCMSTDEYKRIIATVNSGQGALFQILTQQGRTAWRTPEISAK